MNKMLKKKYFMLPLQIVRPHRKYKMMKMECKRCQIIFQQEFVNKKMFAIPYMKFPVVKQSGAAESRLNFNNQHHHRHFGIITIITTPILTNQSKL